MQSSIDVSMDEWMIFKVCIPALHSSRILNACVKNIWAQHCDFLSWPWIHRGQSCWYLNWFVSIQTAGNEFVFSVIPANTFHWIVWIDVLVINWVKEQIKIIINGTLIWKRLKHVLFHQLKISKHHIKLKYIFKIYQRKIFFWKNFLDSQCKFAKAKVFYSIFNLVIILVRLYNGFNYQNNKRWIHQFVLLLG